jgi:hypothetical protein
MKSIKRFVERFIDNEMNWEYMLRNGTLIKVGEQNFKNKLFHVDFVGKIGKVPIEVNGEKVICPIYKEKNGEISFVFQNEKILCKNLTHVEKIKTKTPKKKLYLIVNNKKE